MSKVFTLAATLAVPLFLAACQASTVDPVLEESASSSFSSDIDTSESVTTGTGAVMEDMIGTGSVIDENGVYADPSENARD